ncbi:helix-turn-helix domain-containing protein [Gracilimonas sp.]|uniref:helix-turn-helix domain-containing protein n=1 Tax=Gracilimonas sp. TaxID=1974203 RepID=UPI0032ED9C13
MNFDSFIDDLLQRIETIVERVLLNVFESKLPAVIRKTNRKEFITTEELEELTDWSRGKIYYLRKEQGLPYIKEGRSVLFKMEDIEQYLEENKIRID